MDLGVTLGYWLEKTDNPHLVSLPFCPTHHDGNFTRKEFLDAYCQHRGITISSPAFYAVYGVWRLVIILEQIYKRYVDGHTQDERFATMGRALPLLVQHAFHIQEELS